MRREQNEAAVASYVEAVKCAILEAIMMNRNDPDSRMATRVVVSLDTLDAVQRRAARSRLEGNPYDLHVEETTQRGDMCWAVTWPDTTVQT